MLFTEHDHRYRPLQGGDPTQQSAGIRPVALINDVDQNKCNLSMSQVGFEVPALGQYDQAKRANGRDYALAGLDQ
jgi:hypothetical protein